MYKSLNKILIGSLVGFSSLLSVTLPSEAANIKVTVTNLTDGSFFSPVSSIFHDGSFDNFDLGQAASLGIENISEDGNPSTLNSIAANLGFLSGTVGAAPITPGTTVSEIFKVNPAQGRYFNFASMFVPSNDAFIGNDDATEYEIFDANGNFISQVINVLPSEIWDAGTEVNDEISPNAAIPGQPFTNGAGIAENGVVTVHPGYISGGTLEILGFTSPTSFDPNSPVFRIEVVSTPEPTAILGLFTFGGLFLVGKKRSLNK